VRVTDLPTPQVLIDRARLVANLDRMQGVAEAGGVRLRPHAKTHKSPTIARMQVDRGAIGICCAKVGEAEVFASEGIADIRLPYPVHPSNASRLSRLMDLARISIIVDHEAVARAWSEAMRGANRTLDVLVKVDVGFHRCGIDPADSDAAGFVRRVAGLSGLRLLGLLSHAGHVYHAASQDEVKGIAESEARMLTTLAREAGVDIAEISVGATPTAPFSARLEGLTEIRPGNYVYFDRTQVGLQAARYEDCALTVLARVVSRPARDRVILDCGSKTLTSDQSRGFGPTPGYGVVLRDLESSEPDDTLLIERLSEEHATVRVLSGDCALEPGNLVRVLPNHSCVVSNLVDCVRMVDGLTVVDTLPVSARGKIY
jgi:D-serine deaminase-like pyridoxal phosphate-dependent protein